jgi:hypothetical protein
MSPLDDELVNQPDNPRSSKGGREVILSVIDDATPIGEVRRPLS